MKLPKVLRRKTPEQPPLRKRGEDTPPDPDGKAKLWRGGGDGSSSGNGDNRESATRYAPGI